MCDSVPPPACMTVMSQESVQWAVELQVRIWGSNEVYTVLVTSMWY